MPAAPNPKTPRRHHASAETDDKVRRFVRNRQAGANPAKSAHCDDDPSYIVMP